jgi:hypothetical protein
LRVLEDDSRYLDWILGSNSFLLAANTIRTLGKIRNGDLAEIKSLRKIQSVGVKDFSLNLQKAGLSEFLLARPHIKVVGLLRQNVVERMVSNEMLEITGLVKLRSDQAYSQRRKIRILPETVLGKLACIEAENMQLLEMLKDLPQQRVFRTDYEDLFASTIQTERIVREIYAFLGASDYRPKVRMKKILQKDPLRDIANADQVRYIISGSRFGHYLVS